jgi:hypothetical protein
VSGAVGVALLVTLTGCGSTSSDDDRQLTYCLSSVQQTRLVEAAAALGIAEPGTQRGRIKVDGVDMTVAEWHTTGEKAEDTQDFDRACAAIAPQPGPSAWVAALQSFLNVLAGGLVALASTAWVTRSTRRRQAATAVREATRRLARSVQNLVRQRSERTYTVATGDAVAERIAALDVALHNAQALGRSDTVTPTFEAVDELSRLLAAGWPDVTRDDVDAHIAGLDSAVDDVRAKSDVVADRLDHLPWRRR